MLQLNYRKPFVTAISKGISISLLFALLLYMFINALAPRKVLNIFRYQHFVISSTSMEPVLAPGDLIFVRKTNIDQLVENETIISFYNDVQLRGEKDVVTHYFAYIEERNNTTYIRTHRAGTTNVDSWSVLKEDLIGEYSFKVKKIGKTVLFFTHPIGRRVILMDIIIIYLIIMLLKEPEQSDDDDKKIKYREVKKTLFK